MHIARNSETQELEGLPQTWQRWLDQALSIEERSKNPALVKQAIDYMQENFSEDGAQKEMENKFLMQMEASRSSQDRLCPPDSETRPETSDENTSSATGAQAEQHSDEVPTDVTSTEKSASEVLCPSFSDSVSVFFWYCAHLFLVL